MLRERRKRLIKKMKNRRIFFYIIIILLIITATILMIVFGTPNLEPEESDLLAIAGVVILPLVISESIKQGFSYLKEHRKSAETEEKIKEEFKHNLVRFIYHWDLGTLRPAFFVLHEEIVKLLEKNMIIILKEVNEIQFSKIEELYKIALEFKIPDEVSKNNYKNRFSNKSDLKKFNLFVTSCRELIESWE